MMLQPDLCGSVLSSLMGIVAVVAARNLENTLTLVLVRRTADGGAMFTLLTKLLLPQLDMLGHESIMKSKNKPLKH